MRGAKWKSALIGAAVFGFLGPGVGLLLLESRVIKPLTPLRVVQFAYIVFRGWIFAFAAVGPEGIVVGAIAGLIIESLSRMLHSIKLATAAAMVGLAAECLAVAGTFALARLSAPRQTFRDSVFDYLPVASLTGVVCSFALLLLLRVLGISIRRNRSETSA